MSRWFEWISDYRKRQFFSLKILSLQKNCHHHGNNFSRIKFLWVPKNSIELVWFLFHFITFQSFWRNHYCSPKQTRKPNFERRKFLQKSKYLFTLWFWGYKRLYYDFWNRKEKFLTEIQLFTKKSYLGLK